jgi:hypothetical protein
MKKQAIKQFNFRELGATLGDLSESEYEVGGRIYEIFGQYEIEGILKEINYNENLLNFLERKLD